jgi:hypothetical protein
LRAVVAACANRNNSNSTTHTRATGLLWSVQRQVRLLLQAGSALVFIHLAIKQADEKNAHTQHEHNAADTHQAIVSCKKVCEQLHDLGSSELMSPTIGLSRIFDIDLHQPQSKARQNQAL